MLAAFTARPIVELKQRDKSKIESILAYGDRLLVGLNTGVLRIYRINEPVEFSSQPPTPPVESTNGSTSETSGRPIVSESRSLKSTELLREQEKFSRYKIEQLAVIKEANILVSLSNGYICMHDLASYELQEQLAKTKGASTFAVASNIVKDPRTGVPSIVSRLAVAVKRRLLVWSWHDMELEEEVVEMVLVSGIKTLTWVAGSKLVAGLSSSYVLVDVESQNVTDIVGPGSIGGGSGQENSRLGGVGVASMSYIGMGGMIPKPLATRLGEGEVLLAKDINTHFMDTDGNSLGKRQVPWATAPEAIGYSYPYLLGLFPAGSGTLEVRNPDTLSLLQSIQLPGANLLLVPQPNISLAHAAKGFLVASERAIWRMGALDYDSQIDALVENDHLDEAISLLGMLEDALLKDKEGRLRDIRMMKAERLFTLKKYRDSLDLFMEVAAPPQRVIRLYPKIIAGDASEKLHMEDASSIADGESTTHGHTKTNSQISGEISKHVEKWGHTRSKHRSRASIGSSETSSIRGKESGAERTLEGRDLRSAVLELRSFLADIRRKLQRYLNTDGIIRKEGFEPPSSPAHQTEFDSAMYQLGLTHIADNPSRQEQLNTVARLVDTCLFRAHMLVTPSLAGSLFRLPNFCDPDVVIEQLESSHRYTDLIDFLFGKKMHRKALELLRKFGQSASDEISTSPTRTTSSDTAPEVDPQLVGPKRTIAYLQNLPPEMINLILEFAEWPIRTDPELGMEIFLADTENSETLPRQKVLEFLQRHDERLAVRYLEHVVGELGDMSPDLHTRLLNLYLERLKRRDFKDEEEEKVWKSKFEGLLRSSEQYSASKMLERLPRDDGEFYEARAIVFSKMGQHKQALEIYVFKLQDPERAEEYCNRIHLLSTAPQTASVGTTKSGQYPNQTQTRSSQPYRRISTSADPEDAQPSIYQTLLSLYLSPPAQYHSKPQYGPAIALLANHGSRLPASSTLNIIPEELPVKELEFYFKRRMRAAVSVVNEGRVVKGLRGVDAAETEARLLLGDEWSGTVHSVGGEKKQQGRSRRFEVSEVKVCGVCHKRLGGSVISCFPDNSVVHLGCASRKV